GAAPLPFRRRGFPLPQRRPRGASPHKFPAAGPTLPPLAARPPAPPAWLRYALPPASKPPAAFPAPATPGRGGTPLPRAGGLPVATLLPAELELAGAVPIPANRSGRCDTSQCGETKPAAQRPSPAPDA